MSKLKSTARIESGSSLTPITAKNYVDRAMAFIRAHDGEGFVIVAPDAPPKLGSPTPAAWRAWVSYLSDLGVKTTYMRGACVGTVPCEWPEDFDAKAPASDKLWAPFPEQQHSAEHCAAMRQRISAEFAKLSGGLPASPSAKPRRMTQAEAAAHLEELRALPLTVSPELAQRIAGGA